MNTPWSIGGNAQALEVGSRVLQNPEYTNSKNDVLIALQAWVENGTAPTEIITAYNGTGDPDLPESWDCRSLY
jgi:feruloyl esterase